MFQNCIIKHDCGIGNLISERLDFAFKVRELDVQQSREYPIDLVFYFLKKRDVINNNNNTDSNDKHMNKFRISKSSTIFPVISYHVKPARRLDWSY